MIDSRHNSFRTLIIGVSEGNFNGYTVDVNDREHHVICGATADEAADWIVENNFHVRGFMYSSSCDFATEYGFHQDDARELLENAIIERMKSHA